MKTFWILVLHFVLLSTGLLGLYALARAGAAPGKLHRTALLYALATGAFLFAVSDPVNLMEDFRVAYHTAGAAVLDGPQGLAPLIEHGVEGFVNLPIVAYLFVPFALLPKMSIAVVAFTLLGIVCVHASWKMLVRHARLDALQSGQLLVVFAASGPLLYSFREGNISHMLLWPLALVLVWLRCGREISAGVVLGLLAVLKPPLLLLGVYFALRARWRVVGGSLLAGTAVVLASLVVFGWDFHLRWYELCIAPYGRDPMAAFNVQSLLAFAARLEQGAAGLFDWRVVPLGTATRMLVMLLGSAIVLSLLVVALAPCRLRGPRLRLLPAPAVREIEFMMCLLLACIASPLAWTHYYAWALVPTAFLLGQTTVASTRPLGSVLVWVAVGLTSMPVRSLYLPSGWMAELYARTMSSAVLFGGMLMLAMLALARWHSVAAAPLQGGGASAATAVLLALRQDAGIAKPNERG